MTIGMEKLEQKLMQKKSKHLKRKLIQILKHFCQQDIVNDDLKLSSKEKKTKNLLLAAIT